MACWCSTWWWKMAVLSPTVFVSSISETFKRTHTHTHIFTHTYTRTHIPTNAIGENAERCISLKNQTMPIDWHTLAIGIVHLDSWHSLTSWDRHSPLYLFRLERVLPFFAFHERTFHCILFKWRSRTLMIWIKTDRQTVLVNMHKCAQIGVFMSSYCSQYIIVHFVKDGRTNEQTPLG